jgi:hypothetical protein
MLSISVIGNIQGCKFRGQQLARPTNFLRLRLIFMGPQYDIYFLSPIRSLEFVFVCENQSVKV